MSAESVNARLTVLNKRLEELCALAMSETDSAKQGEVSAEIYRIVAEKQRIENSDSSEDLKE